MYGTAMQQQFLGGFSAGGFYKLALTDFRISFEGRVAADEGA